MINSSLICNKCDTIIIIHKLSYSENYDLLINFSCKCLPQIIPFSQFYSYLELSNHCLNQNECDCCQNRSDYFCIICKSHLCIKCTKWHKKKNHLILSDSIMINYKIQCQNHKKKNIQFFCTKCHQEICYDCQKDHKYHKIFTIMEFSSLIKQQILKRSNFYQYYRTLAINIPNQYKQNLYIELDKMIYFILSQFILSEDNPNIYFLYSVENILKIKKLNKDTAQTIFKCIKSVSISSATKKRTFPIFLHAMENKRIALIIGYPKKLFIFEPNFQSIFFSISVEDFIECYPIKKNKIIVLFEKELKFFDCGQQAEIKTHTLSIRVNRFISLCQINDNEIMIICTDRFRCITYYRAYLMIKYNLDTHQGVDFDGPTGDYLNRIIHIDYFSKWIIIMKMFDGIVLYNYILNNILTIFDYKNSGDFSLLKFSHYFLILFKRKTESKIDYYDSEKCILLHTLRYHEDFISKIEKYNEMKYFCFCQNDIKLIDVNSGNVEYIITLTEKNNLCRNAFYLDNNILVILDSEFVKFIKTKKHQTNKPLLINSYKSFLFKKPFNN